MAIRVVRLGTPRARGEGLRIGTVRRPPRGVAKARFSADDWFDVWLPILAPSPELVASAQAASSDADWRRFAARYVSEMNRPDPSRLLDLLAALSHQASFSVGCYCEDERRCHRSLLGKLLEERGAKLKTR
jgi:uncharacterized protein YeaO (DUF488 family)